MLLQVLQTVCLKSGYVSITLVFLPPNPLLTHLEHCVTQHYVLLHISTFKEALVSVNKTSCSPAKAVRMFDSYLILPGVLKMMPFKFKHYQNFKHLRLLRSQMQTMKNQISKQVYWFHFSSTMSNHNYFNYTVTLTVQLKS